MAALVALAPVPVRAEACADAWGRVGGLIGLPLSGNAHPAADGWCEVWDAGSADLDGLGFVVAIDLLRWRGDGLDAFAGGSGLPTALEVEVEGLRTVPHLGDPGMDWLMRAQAERSGIDGRLVIDWSRDTRVLTVAGLDLDLPGRSAVALTASVTGVDLSSLGTAQTSLGSFAVTDLTVEVVMDGLFETYLLLPAGGILLAGVEDPEAEVKALRAQALAEIGRLPEAIFPGETRQALAAFVEALPNPAGALHARLDASDDPGLGPSRFVGFALSGVPSEPAGWWSVLDGLTLSVDWTPLPPLD